MWDICKPRPAKLIIGILAADRNCLSAAVDILAGEFGKFDFTSDTWPFDQTDYYKDQMGQTILRQFVSVEKLIDPGSLADIKHKTNEIEQQLAAKSNLALPRPVNLDPGIIEPSKLVLASTKNFSHRIYIGSQMYAEVTLMFQKGKWQTLPFTFPDYASGRYHGFLSKIRDRLVEQLKNRPRNNTP